MSNFSAIRKKLAPSGLDAILLLSPVNRRYAAGFPSSAGAVLVTGQAAYLITDSRYIEAARQTVTDAVVAESSREKRQNDWLREILSAHGVQRLGFEEHWISYAAFGQLQTAFPGLTLVPAQALLDQLRMVKRPEELACMRQAQAIAEAALERVLPQIRPGVSEREIAAELSYQMLRLGAEGNSFDPIVVAGKKSSMPHGVPGDETIAPGDFVTMDFGCLKGGYCSDMTRTVAVGHASEEMRRVYGTVLRAQEAGIAAARAGVEGHLVHAAGEAVIEAAGYGGCFGHGFGHGLGLEIHEAPNFSPGETRLIPAGAVLSAEPGIYLPGRFGVRIEDVIHITEDGCENLTRAPKALLVL